MLQTYSKNGQVNQQASADRPVSSLNMFLLNNDGLFTVLMVE